jgi:hypothetical protein
MRFSDGGNDNTSLKGLLSMSPHSKGKRIPRPTGMPLPSHINYVVRNSQTEHFPLINQGLAGRKMGFVKEAFRIESHPPVNLQEEQIFRESHY